MRIVLRGGPLRIRTVVLRGIVAIGRACGFTFVGCASVEETSRRLTLHVAIALIACVIRAEVHLFVVYRELLTLYAEYMRRAGGTQTLT
jgi:hypothetical protein